jgi:hypothetical protein
MPLWFWRRLLPRGGLGVTAPERCVAPWGLAPLASSAATVLAARMLLPVTLLGAPAPADAAAAAAKADASFASE